MALRKKHANRSVPSRGGAKAAGKIELKKFSNANRLRANLHNNGKAGKKNNRFSDDFKAKMRGSVVWGGGIFLGLLLFFVTGLSLVYAYNFFTNSAYFALKTIEIDGHNRLKSREVLESAGVNYGQNSLALSIEELEKALAGNPWVAELSVKRMLPDGLRIVIKEYEPKYWIKQDGALVYADAYGTPIAPVAPGGFSSLPVLEIEQGAEYLSGQLPKLVQSLEHLNFPLSVSTASWVRLTASRTLELRLGEGARLVIGLDNWDANVFNLVKVLDDLSRRGELKQMSEIRAHGKDVWVAKRPA